MGCIVNIKLFMERLFQENLSGDMKFKINERLAKRGSFLARSLLTTVAALGLSLGVAANRVNAQSANPERFFPVSINGIDNPCTLGVEALTLEGFLQQLNTSSGNSQFHTILKDTQNRYLVQQIFTTVTNESLASRTTNFSQLLISQGAEDNFKVDGKTVTDLNTGISTATFSTKCLGSNN